MSVQFSLDRVSNTAIKTLGLGVFDGLHRAHQAITTQCDAILTFSPHPDTVLRGTIIPTLTTHEEMRTLFQNTIILNFNKEIAALTPDAFLEHIMQTLNPQTIIAGYDYRFGAKRAGDMTYLTEWGKSNNTKIITVPPQKEDDELIKSGRIRTALKEGDFEKAIQYLGRPYLVMGTVVHGEGRGHDLGYPTANIAIPEGKLLPQNGVYAARLIHQKFRHKAIAYIGSKPTFNGTKTTLEVHIPKTDISLYTEKVSVELTAQIRGELTFDSPELLIEQIKVDLKNI